MRRWRKRRAEKTCFVGKEAPVLELEKWLYNIVNELTATDLFILNG